MDEHCRIPIAVALALTALPIGWLTLAYVLLP
jgi:hypothetical protein